MQKVQETEFPPFRQASVAKSSLGTSNGVGGGGLVSSSRHPCRLKSREGISLHPSLQLSKLWLEHSEGEAEIEHWVCGGRAGLSAVASARIGASQRQSQRGEAAGVREGRRQESERGGGGSQGAEVAGVRGVVGVSWETSHTWVQVCGATGSGAFPPHTERTTGRVTAKAQS